MGKRRLLAGTVLFILAGIILILMNRYSDFFLGRPDSGMVDIGMPEPVPIDIDIFNPEDGSRRGRLTADTVEGLPDGMADYRGVSLDLEGTEFGDVTLTCDRALLKLEEISGFGSGGGDSEGVAGMVVLEGNVRVKAEGRGQEPLSGSFEKLSYDAGARRVTAEGKVDLAWGTVLRVRGTGLAGTVEPAHFEVSEDVTVDINVPEDAERDEELSGFPSELKVTAGGPLAFDAALSTIAFGGGVHASGGEFVFDGKTLELAFDQEEPETGDKSARWTLESVVVTGPAKASDGSREVAGSLIRWSADGASALVEGAPGRLKDEFYEVEAPKLALSLDDDDALLLLDATGPGWALMSDLPGGLIENIALGAAEPEAEGQTPPLEGEEPAETAEAKVPAKVSWGESISFSAAEGVLKITGGAAVEQGGAGVSASDISVTMTPPPSRELVNFAASGNVVFRDGYATVEAQTARFTSASDVLTMRGEPVKVSAPGAVFSSSMFEFRPEAGALTAPHGCRLEVEVETGEDDEGKPVTETMTVTAAGMDADLSGDVVSANLTGGVNVRYGDGVFEFDTCSVTGIPHVIDPMRSGDTPGDAAQADISMEGEGNVVFTRGAFRAAGDSFSSRQKDRVVTLGSKPGSRVEMTYDKSVTIWADSVTVDSSAGKVTCSTPEVAAKGEDLLMGFLGSSSGDGRRKVAEVYLNADSMTVEGADTPAPVIVFDGNVDAVSRNVEANLDDRLTAGRLTLNIEITPEEDSQPQAPGALPADLLQRGRSDITAAKAEGGVTLRYSGPEGELLGRGESFAWEKQSNSGTLTGDPAFVRLGGSDLEVNSIVLDFTSDAVSIKGGGRGSLLLMRKKKATDAK